MQPENKKLLFDMKEAADSILTFLADKSIADFKSDKLLRSGVYYQYTIIGEALSKLRERDAATASRISESDRIIGFRNQVVHGYAKINDDITWRIFQDKLPILSRELEQLLAE
jgi:uncharacterized protein with HEPN domain